MPKAPEKKLYRVTFHNQGKIFEVFARNVSQGGLFGFIELEHLVFGEKSTILVDPTEDALKREFESVKRVYIPMHSVIRVDEMEKGSQLKPRIVAMAGASEGKGETDIPRLTPLYTPTNPFTNR